MRRMFRRGALVTLAGMAWRNRSAIQRAVQNQSQRRSNTSVRR